MCCLAEERIAVVPALRSVTSAAAWQTFDEESRGAIHPGKIADLVILERNPLAVEPAAIRDIAVLETIVAVESVCRR